jgi:preprotein translocase subunit SecA
MIYNVEVRIEGENGDGAVPAQQRGGAAALQYSGGTLDDQPSAYGEPGEEAYEPSPVIQQRRVEENEQLGRNDPCWCGSGKKFKKCHGA